MRQLDDIHRERRDLELSAAKLERKQLELEIALREIECKIIEQLATVRTK